MKHILHTLLLTLLMIVALLSVATMLTGCGKAGSVSGRTVQVFGDSHATGTAGLEGYAAHFGRSLGLPLDNQAVAGSYLALPLGPRPSQLSLILQNTKHTDIKVFMPGYNDSWDGLNVAQFKAALKTAIPALSSLADVVLIGTPLQPSGAAYAQAVRDAVSELGLSNVYLVDVALWNFSPSLLLSDGMHFNAQGSYELSNLFLNKLSEVL